MTDFQPTFPKVRYSWTSTVSAQGSTSSKQSERASVPAKSLIAVIGKRWLIASDKEGRRRIDNPDDFVRFEIATAVKRNIRVIPVLVDGALMPQSSDLPDDLQLLIWRQALELGNNRFNADLGRLIAALERAFQERLEAERRERTQKDLWDWEEQVMRCISAKDFANAMLLLQKAADAGDTSAMFNLGVFYDEGKEGVAKDYGKAREWYQKAVDAGYEDAKIALLRLKFPKFLRRLGL
jgi:TPR repeat protein